MDKGAFINVMRAAVAQYFPDELMAFDLGASRQVDRIFAGQNAATNPSAIGGEFRFDVASVEHALKFIVLCGSAFSAAKTLVGAMHAKSSGKERNEELAALWKERLVAQGIPSERAAEIAASFSGDLAAVVSGGKG